MFCKNCGEQLEDDQKFCHKCGSPVEDAAETTETLSPEKVVVESTAEVEASPSEPVMAQSPEGYAVSDDSQAGEIYYSPKWIKITLLCIACFCLLMAILTFKTPLEFNWFFGSCSYSLGFGVLTIGALAYFAVQFGEHRHTRNYLTPDGKLDISTPRSYTALEKPWLLRALDTDNYGFGDTLESFDYADGRIAITTRKGQMIEAPLSELTWKYSMTKPSRADEWHIYKYTLTDQSGHTIKFYRKLTIEDEEWDDINMLLSLSGEVKEGKTSKLSKKMSKILESVRDQDLGSLAESLTEILVNETSTKVIDLVKAKYITKLEKKEGLWSKIKKVFEYLVWIILAIYALTVIFVNVVELISYLSSDDNRDEIEAVVNSVDTDDSESATSQIYHLTGVIDGKYNIDMTLDFESGTGTYYYTKYSPDNTLDLVITSLDDGEIEIQEFNDNGDQTGVFKGRIHNNGEINGWYTNYKGSQMPFSIEVDAAQNTVSILQYIVNSADYNETYDGYPAYFYKGYFTDGKKQYPVMVAFVNVDGTFEAAYKNLNYGGTVMSMMISDISDNSLTLKSYDGDFRITLSQSGEGELSGSAKQGSTKLDVSLTPTFDTF